MSFMSAWSHRCYGSHGDKTRGIISDVRSVSRADRDLIDCAAKRGVALTATQLERWRHAGVFPRASREYGGTRGGRSSYPSWAIDQAVEVAELTGRGRTPLTNVALTLFVRERWVSEDALRAALHRMLDHQLFKITTGASPDNPLDIAERFASEMDRDLDAPSYEISG